MASKAMIGNTDPMQPETAVEKERRHRIQRVNRKYEFARTRFICSAGNNPALNWRIGFRLNVSSLRNNRIRFRGDPTLLENARLQGH
jgi:hypothetical protein